MDWTGQGLDQHVSFTESYPLFVKSHFDDSKPFNPATDLPESKLNRVQEWNQEQPQVDAEGPSSALTASHHPCQVLAEHWDDIFHKYPFASHLFDGAVASLLARSSTCALCKLFAQAPMFNTGDPKPSHFAVYAVNLLGERERLLAAEDYAPENYTMGLTVSVGCHLRPHRHLRGLARRNHRHGTQGLFVPVAEKGGDDARSPYMARMSDPKQVDFGLLREWIEKCQNEHSACRKVKEESVDVGIVLQVVDCRAKTKVSLPPGEPYLALSYRWGPLPECEDPWGVSAAPRTVRDAMALCLRLGFRYLWVDRHCIDQDDAVNKAKELAAMDYIYENATLTIVAMAGSDDTYGLPGIGTEPAVFRNEPSRVTLGGHMLVSLNPDILTSVQRSEWATRAWTFQEALLSRRCLLFTPEQVYFICRTTYWSEFLPRFPRIRYHEDSGAATATTTTTEYDPYSGTDPEISISNLFYFESGGLDPTTSELDRLQRDVNIYMKRVMGDQNDGLNAFRGVLSRSFYWSYYGVPLITRAGRELGHNNKDDDTNDAMVGPPPMEPEREVLLDGLPKTMVASASVRIIVGKYLKDRHMERMISATATSASTLKKKTKTRARKTLFGGTYHDEYTYDHLAGPGEPVDPSPTLAFLRGLGWAVGDACHRRPPMPTWSWVSVYGGALRFGEDPDGTKEIPTDVWTTMDCDVRVWVPADKGGSMWTEFDTAMRGSSKKVIPELGRLIKIESRVGDIETVIFRPREHQGAFSFDKVSVSMSVAGMPGAAPYEMCVDCPEELPPPGSSTEETTWDNLGWRLVLISRTSVYNPEPKWRHMWADWQATDAFLVIRPAAAGPYWERVGLLKTKDKLYRVMKRDTVVLT